jgi:hypothetical protein
MTPTAALAALFGIGLVCLFVSIMWDDEPLSYSWVTEEQHKQKVARARMVKKVAFFVGLIFVIPAILKLWLIALAG